ncbi:MAG: hypothetical protein E6G92_02160 [Alphaproteobacteria bacterium]|nr:MAG: hypothetical protein E6G92_02160 [Alphaproteobacteria bacterium]
MDKKYWIGRKHASMRMARAATSAEARLIHYDLAGRYSVNAANAVPFMLPRKAPSEGEQAALQIHLPPPPGRKIAERPRLRPRFRQGALRKAKTD